MEKRIGAALIVVESKSCIPRLNSLLSEHSEIIIARQGLPLQEKGISIISLVLEGSSHRLNALIGPIGKLDGISVKSMMMPSKK